MNLTLDCKTVRIFAYKAFSITWPASMQIYGTNVTSCENALFKYARAVKQKVWNDSQNRERDWGETLKIRFFSLASHALQACKARARRARKTLTPRLPISLLILRKKPTVLQSNSTRKYFFMCRYVTRFKFTFSPFAVKVIVNNLSINSKIGRQR